MAKSGISGVDFVSGRSYLDIIVELLDNFTDLAEPVTIRAQEDLMDDAKFVCEACLQRNPEDLQFSYLETGSNAENVRAVSNTRTGMRGMNMNLTHVFAAERDIMAFTDIKNLTHQTYRLVPVAENPCFVTIPLDPLGDTEKEEDGKQLDEGQYISSLGYFDMVKQRLGENLSQIVGAGIARSCFITDISDHGPALMLTFKRIRGLSPKYSTDNNTDQVFSDHEGIFSDEALIDLVPAIRLPEWPEAAKEWVTRSRRWPDAALIDSMVSEGVLAVYKCSPSGGDSLIDWRLSFSRAEVTLIANREFPCRQHAHRIFKYIVKHKISPPSVLNSYHCKTVLLWASERLPPELWKWDRLAHCVLGLLDDLIACIGSRQCPHYFIRNVNLFENILPEFLQTAGERLVAIRRSLEMGRCKVEILQTYEAQPLSQYGIGLRRNPQVVDSCKFRTTLSSLEEDIFMIYRCLLKYKFGYSAHNMASIDRQYQKDLEQAEAHGGKFWRDVVPLCDILGKDNIPALSIFGSFEKPGPKIITNLDDW